MEVFAATEKLIIVDLHLMVIAINTIGLARNRDNENIYFLKELFVFLAERQPNHSFVFIVNAPLAEDEILPSNCTIDLVKTNPKNNLQLIYFLAISFKFIIKKIQPNVLVHLSGYCSASNKISQLLVVKNDDFPTSIISNYFFKKSLQKATKILVNSSITRQKIITKFQIPNLKFQTIKGAANQTFQPLDYLDKDAAKDGNADGREYFLSIAETYEFDDFIALLKAFSIFKRWQKSSMKLLVIGSVLDYKDHLTEKIITYKYRDDIVFINDVLEDIKAKLIGAAYAVLSLSQQVGFALPILHALQSCVPVIASNTADLKEYFGDIILYVTHNDVEELANQMKLLYRDENQRNLLVTKGSQLAVNFSYQHSADALWSSINTAI